MRKISREGWWIVLITVRPILATLYQGLTLVPISAQLKLTLPLSAQLQLTLSLV